MKVEQTQVPNNPTAKGKRTVHTESMPYDKKNQKKLLPELLSFKMKNPQRKRSVKIALVMMLLAGGIVSWQVNKSKAYERMFKNILKDIEKSLPVDTTNKLPADTLVMDTIM